ncbi:hypothetical protein ACLMJK_006783 [Lecanora helva]
MHCQVAAVTAFIALALAAPNPLSENPPPTTTSPPPQPFPRAITVTESDPLSYFRAPHTAYMESELAKRPKATPKPDAQAWLASVSTSDCGVDGKDEAFGPNSNINRTCNGFTRGTNMNNVFVYFGRGTGLAKAFTLYTDQNCKTVGKAETIKKQDNQNSTCLHAGDFGGETWGSVMQTA